MARLNSSSSSGTVTIVQDGNVASVNSDGSLNVNVLSTEPSFPQETLSIFSDVSSVASGATVTVLTYTVPPGLTLYMNKFLVSGDSISSFDLQFDGSTNARKRLTYAVFNETFDYSLNGNIGGFKIDAGTVITMVVTNNSPAGAGNFNATLQGVLQ